MKKILEVAILVLICMTGNLKAQNVTDYIDPEWEQFYKIHPSGIENNFSANDFIKIVDKFDFVPCSKDFNHSAKFFKRVLLMLDFPSLRQMKINGLFYASSYKHDDYYTLYNLSYNKISKADWDRYCPYLIGLMSFDGLIK